MLSYLPRQVGINSCSIHFLKIINSPPSLKNRVLKHKKINTLIFRDCKFIKKTKQNDKMQKNNQIIMEKDLKLTKEEELPFSLRNCLYEFYPNLGHGVRKERNCGETL